ncbi:murein hydrolase activator EnvC family protein [Neobacillus kokaensis]|uniref:Peptidase M24 n=1 Tax=Neobacillus kokaensis TaxID=2759023 RepID=A0ABQ3MYJ3_9BACI|nr:peptidoglycan DD-metalloendopeptidase family protein [Neobacillus kokaensis]GHH97487.1 peptidase M24 [Neobacillus kokaensis]
MKKTVLTLTVAATVGLGTMFGGSPEKIEAASSSKLNEIQNQRSGVKTNINKANEKISNLQKQQSAVNNDLERIDLAISDITDKISDKNTKIKETKTEINKLKGDIKVIKDRMEKRSELLKERARSYQENGGAVNYLDVLFGAQSFNDFIDRANAVATLVIADQEIFKQHEADKIELEKKEAKVKKDLAGLETMLADLKEMNQQLSAQRAEKNKLLAKLKKEESEAHEYVIGLQEKEGILAAQEAAIQRAIKAEEERQARAAAEAKKAAEARQKQSSGSSSGSSSAGAVSAAPAAPAVSGGSFTRPAAGVITSTYGARWGTFHWGVDIAQGGPVPIVAAADGEVYVSHYSSSYGNVVYILHNINGQMYTTVYAHMRTRMVGAGQHVSKGQQIGVMGNTGDSQGQHLHFELYKGRWQYHSAINPMGIVPL